MRCILLMTVISTCLLGATVDSVYLPELELVLQRTREKFEHSRRDRAKYDAPRKKKNNGRRGKSFKPNNNRCCKVGVKTARKKMSCVPEEHVVTRRMNFVHKAKLNPNKKGMKYARILTAKISKCSVGFAKRFEKCCTQQAEFYKQMKKCKSLKRTGRRRCRKMVKRRYANS